MAFLGESMRFLIFIIALLLSPYVWAEAYCGLRDPVAMISKLYPNYQSYRSIVRTIDARTRIKVSEQLPGMPLHFGELGRHTLYVIEAKGMTQGFVHVRSEQTRWGLVEIAWAIDLEMKIIDFQFQRCRHSDRKYLETSISRSVFQGKSLNGLMLLYDFNNNRPSTAYYKQVKHQGDLSDSVLKCAMKTLLVTQIVWQKELDSINQSLVNEVP